MVLAVDGGAGPVDGSADEVDAGEARVPADAGPTSTDGGASAETPAGSVAGQARTVAPVKLSGRVLARGTRQPLVGAALGIAMGAGARASTETGADGAFTLEVPPGEHQLHVQCPGFVPTTRAVSIAADTADFVVRLEPRSEGERYETVVTAEPQEAASITLKKEELVHTAGSLGDPFRVIESLPGVAQTTWPLPFYAIRGANPGNTGFFIDGVRAPALFHFALGPSVIHPFFIQDLQFYPGGFPVEYGRYVSGIVTANTATPPTDRLHVSADVRLFDVGGIALSPFDHGKGTVAVAGRYSYTGFILSAFSNAYSLDYWDYQIRVQHTLGPGKWTFFAFGSGDNLDQKNPDKTDYGFVGEPQSIAPGLAKLMFHRAQLRWDGAAAGGRLTVAAVAGIDDSTVSLTSLFSLPVGTKMYTLAPRMSERWSLWSWLEFELGADSEIQWARPTSLVALYPALKDYETDLFSNRRILSVGAYTGVTLHAGDRLVLVPGLRYDGYFEQGTEKIAASPRLSVRLRVGEHDWLKAAVGQFSQMPSLPVGVPGFESFGLATYGLQRSQQASLGVESALEDRLGVDVDLNTSIFYQRLHLTDLKDTLIPDPEAGDLLQTREGESYGLELHDPSAHEAQALWLAGLHPVALAARGGRFHRAVGLGPAAHPQSRGRLSLAAQLLDLGALPLQQRQALSSVRQQERRCGLLHQPAGLPTTRSALRQALHLRQVRDGGVPGAGQRDAQPRGVRRQTPGGRIDLRELLPPRAAFRWRAHRVVGRPFRRSGAVD